MNRDEILEKLRKYKKAHEKQYYIVKIGIFGSLARGTMREHSDIDIIIEQKKPDLFILGSIKTELEEELGRKVDIIRLHDRMNQFLKKRIEREAIYA
ncbi:MAG: nucleotidyltransferase domain-containing protein [Deltaproteobacteria bacterium]|nr:nucleotidyltransferase domain-containing protein [Deltaproteobacteria bacterium]